MNTWKLSGPGAIASQAPSWMWCWDLGGVAQFSGYKSEARSIASSRFLKTSKKGWRRGVPTRPIAIGWRCGASAKWSTFWFHSRLWHEENQVGACSWPVAAKWREVKYYNLARLFQATLNCLFFKDLGGLWGLWFDISLHVMINKQSRISWMYPDPNVGPLWEIPIYKPYI